MPIELPGLLEDLASLRRGIAELTGRIEAAARQGQDTASSVQSLAGDVATLTRASERLSKIVEGNGSPGLKTELALVRQIVEALSDADIPETLATLKTAVESLVAEQERLREAHSQKRDARVRGAWQVLAAWGGQVLAFLFALLLAYVTLRHGLPHG